MTVNYTLKPEELTKSIQEAFTLENNEELFGKLADVFKAKKDLKDLLDQIEKIESEAKNAINSKARALYGPNWTAIKGKGYKITRSKAGAVYTRLEGAKIGKRFIKVIESLNTEAIDEELEKTGKLPKGLDFNPNRSEVIRVTLK